MTARRQPSTTSLSKYVRASSLGMENRSLDFCNAFWGIGDGGVEVLFARMRGASRTTEELRNFWKERAVIEEDYAKRLAKLSKVVLGRDEIGDLRNTLNTLKGETEKQAGFHATLASQIRTELENTVSALNAQQLHHKKTFQAVIEKKFKEKQTQDSYVNKAREKYEQDCVRINSYTAQTSLVQGKDLERVNTKLKIAQQSVQTNEREFANLARVLGDTVARWEQDWRTFCDSCQDMEEQRIEFMKDNVWAYANAVSTVCVSDDESCERMRVALEQMEPEKDQENFVHDYGTGNQMPDPPTFVNYNTPNAIPSSSSKPTFRLAQFPRSSNRTERILRQSSIPPPNDIEQQNNAAGIGAGYKKDSQIDSNLTRQTSLARRMQTQQIKTQQAQTNGSSSPPPGKNVVRQSTSTTRHSYNRIPPPDPLTGPIDPIADTFIKIGPNMYKADPSRDPQAQHVNAWNSPTIASSTKDMNSSVVGPLVKHMEDLKNGLSSGGSTRRKSLRRQSTHNSPKAQQPVLRHQNGNSVSRSSLSLPSANNGPPGSSPPPTGASSRDYRNSAELVVGVHSSVTSPPNVSSHPSSPNPPTVAFIPPKTSPSPAGSDLVQEVVTDYQQSFPGEHKSISRSNSLSRRVSTSNPIVPIHTPSPSYGQPNLNRPPSTIGHAGIGVHEGSRSNSPQPISRPASPVQSRPGNGGSSCINPPVGPTLNRAPSPNTMGIALDRDGRVLHDEMAQKYQQQQQQPTHIPLQRGPPPTQQIPPPPPHFQAPPPQQFQPISRQQQQPTHSAYQPRRSPIATAPPPSPIAPYATAYQPFTTATPAPATQLATHPSYVASAPPPPVVQPSQPQQPVYNPYGLQQVSPPAAQAVAVYQPPPPPIQQPVQAPPPHQPQQIGYQPQSQQNGVHHNPQQHQHQQPPAYYGQQGLRTPGYQQGPQYGVGVYREPSPQQQRTPSPQPPTQQMGGQIVAPPTNQTTEDGYGISFYVKALYDYTATIDEEFDFQAGDIIAVTATPDDGWWSGELLDEERRQKGRHVFPSNFVCLF